MDESELRPPLRRLRPWNGGQLRSVEAATLLPRVCGRPVGVATDRTVAQDVPCDLRGPPGPILGLDPTPHFRTRGRAPAPWSACDVARQDHRGSVRDRVMAHRPCRRRPRTPPWVVHSCGTHRRGGQPRGWFTRNR